MTYLNLRKSRMLCSLVAVVAMAITFCLSGTVVAETYTQIQVKPGNIGVFYQNKTQQFKAYGLNQSGRWIDITDEVSWYIDSESIAFGGQDTTPGAVATIDVTGKATVQASWGRVIVNACYPQGCAPGGSITAPSLPLHSLLGITKYTITSTVDATEDDGSISNPLLQVKKNRKAQINLVPDDVTFMVDETNVEGDCPAGVFANKNTEYTTGNILADCNYIFHFVDKPEFTVTSETHASGNGSITPDTQQVPRQDAADFTIAPDPQYEAFIHGDSTCPAGSFNADKTAYSTGEILAPCNVVAQFLPQPIITSSVDPTDNSGTIDPLGDTYVNTGATKMFALTPTLHYESFIHADSTCLDGSFNADKSEYTTGAITADCTVIAQFLPQHQVDLSIDGTDDAGSISPIVGIQYVNEEDTLMVTLTPTDATYMFYVTGTCPAGTYNGNDYTTGQIVGDCTVVAHFRQPNVNSSVSGVNGTVAPSGDNPFPLGLQAEFDLSPTAPYEAKIVSDSCGNGGGFSSDKLKYFTANLTDDCAVVFEFVTGNKLTIEFGESTGDGYVYSNEGEIPPLISCDTLGAIGSDCSEIYPPGTSVTLKAEPLPTDTFAGWSGTGCPASTVSQITFAMNANITCIATFDN